MGTWLATLICSVGVAGLFFLDRDTSVRNSKALWLPVIWLWIAGSRTVSLWLGISGGSAYYSLASTLEGNSFDAAIFGMVIAVGVLVLLGRWKKTSAFVAASGPIILYFFYCLLSVTWSPFHGPAFKRWIKAVGDLVMVLVVATDAQPIAALRRLFSRVGFILLPFSVVLIRYTALGRGFDPEGNPMNTGVTTNKNSLGLIVYLISLGALWNVRSLLIHKDEPNRGRRLVAQATLLAFGLALLKMAHSSTSIACFIFGSGIILATSLPAIKSRPSRINSLCLLIILAGALAFLSGSDALVVHALGRNESFSGRAGIWQACLASAGNPVIGTGFESFWNANVDKVVDHLPGYVNVSNLVSAHNGYIEVYLDLGWIGVSLIALILIGGYRRVGRVCQRNLELGSLFLAYLATGAIYSLTEAGFRVLTPSWIFLLLAVVSAGGASVGSFRKEQKEPVVDLAADAAL